MFIWIFKDDITDISLNIGAAIGKRKTSSILLFQKLFSHIENIPKLSLLGKVH